MRLSVTKLAKPIPSRLLLDFFTDSFSRDNYNPQVIFISEEYLKTYGEKDKSIYPCIIGIEL